jgi:hypothetical protein
MAEWMVVPMDDWTVAHWVAQKALYWAERSVDSKVFELVATWVVLLAGNWAAWKAVY